jgi:hypothetical protein
LGAAGLQERAEQAATEKISLAKGRGEDYGQLRRAKSTAIFGILVNPRCAFALSMPCISPRRVDVSQHAWVPEFQHSAQHPPLTADFNEPEHHVAMRAITFFMAGSSRLSFWKRYPQGGRHC